MLYGEDVYVGYRYYEGLEVEPLFPFGHGLSYTSFQVSDLNINNDSEKILDVSCKVQNTGSRKGAEVVQLYIAPVSPPIRRPLKELKEFRKVFLDSGAEENVTIALDITRATSFWDEKTKSWCSYEGAYKVMVGTSSGGEFLETVVNVSETTYWSGGW